MYRHALEQSREVGEIKKEEERKERNSILFALVGFAVSAQGLPLPRFHFWQFIPAVVSGRIRVCKGNLTKHRKV